MIISTEKLSFDLVKMDDGRAFRRISANDWEFELGEFAWEKIKDEKLEKEYQIFKDKEMEIAFLNAP